jgi:hypothetical protein
MEVPDVKLPVVEVVTDGQFLMTPMTPSPLTFSVSNVTSAVHRDYKRSVEK